MSDKFKRRMSITLIIVIIVIIVSMLSPILVLAEEKKVIAEADTLLIESTSDKTYYVLFEKYIYYVDKKTNDLYRENTETNSVELLLEGYIAKLDGDEDYIYVLFMNELDGRMTFMTSPIELDVPEWKLIELPSYKNINGGITLFSVNSQSSMSELESAQLGKTCAYYESGGKAGKVSTGKGDSGGKSYGAFQFSSNNEVPVTFAHWCINTAQNISIGQRIISAYNSYEYESGFDTVWKSIANEHYDEFYRLQRMYTKACYYDVQLAKIHNEIIDFSIDNYGIALREAIYSRSVQHGDKTGLIVNVFKKYNFLNSLPSEKELIRAIYAESGKIVNYKPGANSLEIKLEDAQNIGHPEFAGKYMRYFSGNSSPVQVNVWVRLNINELNTLLNLSDEYNYIITPTTPTISYPSNVHEYISGYECTNFDLDADGELSVWYDSENAVKYNYSIKKLAADPNPSSDNEGVLLDSGVTSESSINIPSPNYGTWYKVGIQAASSTGHTSSWKVRYIRTKCAKPYLTQPSSDVEMNSDEYIALRWNNGTNNSKSYLKLIELQGKPNPSSESEPYSRIIVNEQVCSGNTYYASNLTAGKYYKVMVKARNTAYSEAYMPYSWSSSPVYIYVNESTQSTIPVTSVVLNQTSTTLEIGETEILFATVKPTNATNQNVTWKSSNTNVASVLNGQVTAKSAGTATITVTTADGGHTATCVINVGDGSDSDLEDEILAWKNYADGETIEVTIDTSSAISIRPIIIDYTTTSVEAPLLEYSRGGVIDATLDKTNKTVSVTCKKGGTATIYLSIGDVTISLMFNVTDIAEPSTEFDLSWRDFGNNETFEYTIDSSDPGPNRPYVFWFTLTPEDYAYSTSDLKVSNENVLTATSGESRVTVTPKSGGRSTVTLTIDGKSISLNFIITDTAEESTQDYTLSWSDYSDGDVIERTMDTSGSTPPAYALILYYETESSETPSVTVSDEDVIGVTLYKSSKHIRISNVSVGTSKITLSIGDKSISLIINVTDIATPSATEVESVTLDKTTAFLNENETLTLIASVLPSDATNKNVVWTSSQNGIATVSQYGVVTAISAGTTMITATTEDGGFTDTCKITVIVPVEEDGLVDSGTDENGINWYFYETGLLKISGVGAMQNHSSTATIPWYSEKAYITEIEISDGITHIGNRSFYNCISLEKIAIPNSVTSIGTYTFRNCSEVTIYAESETYIETYAKENSIPFVNTKKEELKTIVVDPYGNALTWCFDISIEEYTEDAIAYAAIYDAQGKLLTITSGDFVIDDVTTLIISKSGVVGASYAKVFVWKNNLEPVALARIVEL